MERIRIINSPWILHQVRRHAQMRLSVVLALVHTHAVAQIHPRLPLQVLGVSVVLVVVLHFITN